MSDSNNQPPDDAWIKSLYRSGKDNEDQIPESVDASILKKARQPQQNTRTKKFQPYRWVYGTAASAVLGIMLILQIPDNEVQSLLEPKVEIRQEQSLQIEPEPRARTSARMVTDSDMSTLTSAAPEIEEVVTTAERREKLPEKARAFIIPLASKGSLSDAADFDPSLCDKYSAYFTNTGEEEVIVQCETKSQLTFQFEQESANACMKTYLFALESTATASIQTRDSESGLHKIQIDTPHGFYTLQCDAGKWILTRMEQP